MRALVVRARTVGLFALLVIGNSLLISRAWSHLTGAVVVVASPTPAQFSPAEQEAIDRAKQYLRDHAKEYRLKPDLSDLRLERVHLDFWGGVVGFRQLYRGYVVAITGVTVYSAPNQKEPFQVSSSYNSDIVLRDVILPYPGLLAPTLAPILSAEDAAARTFAETGAKSRLFASPAKAELVIYPVAKPGSKTVYTLAWDVQMITTNPYGDWGAIIDAWTGEIIVKGNRFVPLPTAGPMPTGPAPTVIFPTLVPEQVSIERALDYLREHAMEYELRPDLSDLLVERVYPGYWDNRVTFAQLYQGIRVSDASVEVIIGNAKPEVTVVSRYVPQTILRSVTPPYPGPNTPTLAPTLSAEDAEERALLATGAKAKSPAATRAELVIWPVALLRPQPVYTLAWSIGLATADPVGEWEIVVDAWTGEILIKKDLFVPLPLPVQPSLTAPRPSPTLIPTRTLGPTGTPLSPPSPIRLGPSKIVVWTPTPVANPPRPSVTLPRKATVVRIPTAQP